MQSQQVRENWAIFALIVVALASCVALAYAGDAATSSTNKCERAHVSHQAKAVVAALASHEA